MPISLLDAHSFPSWLLFRSLRRSPSQSSFPEMPAIYISTNLNLQGVDLDPLLKEITQSLSSILARSTHLVMVVVKGGVEISFGGTKEAAAFVELYSMGGIDKTVKRKLIATVGSLLESHISVPSNRLFCNVTDVSLLRPKL